MSLIDKVTIKYNIIYNSLFYLSEKEWIDMVNLFLNKLAEKPVGNCLITKLEEFIIRGYSVIISNNDFPHNITVFPKIRYIDRNSVIIVIPSVPYFTTVDTIEHDLCSDSHHPEIQNLDRVSKWLPSNGELNIDKYLFFISQERITCFIGMAHELIHCLRYFEGKHLGGELEEANTIYGTKTGVLSYVIKEQIYFLTENSIRKEWGFKARVSHNSIPLLCHGFEKTFVNTCKFTKANFYD